MGSCPLISQTPSNPMRPSARRMALRDPTNRRADDRLGARRASSELKRLRHRYRAEIPEQLREARSYGDDSNNDEYHAVRERRAGPGGADSPTPGRDRARGRRRSGSGPSGCGRYRCDGLDRRPQLPGQEPPLPNVERACHRRQRHIRCFTGGASDHGGGARDRRHGRSTSWPLPKGPSHSGRSKFAWPLGTEKGPTA